MAGLRQSTAPSAQALLSYRRRQIRKVEKLRSAEFIDTPLWTQGARLSGKKARGKAYERVVGRELERLVEVGELDGDLYLGPWIGFEDANGEGLAQPDVVIDYPDFAILGEIKLKQNSLAREQIDFLYAPLLRHILKKKIIGVEIFKYPSSGRNAAWVKELNVLANRKRDGLWIWHYIGI